MSVILPHRRKAFRSSGLSIAPTHWWDLDDDGAWADSVGSWTLTEATTVTISSAGGPGGQDVALFDNWNDYLYILSKNPTTEGLAGGFSASVWAYFTSFNTGNFGNWALNWRGDTNAKIAFQLVYHGEASDALLASGANGVSLIAATAEATSTWYHMVVTWDGAVQKFYINNTLVGTVANTNSMANTPSHLAFGINVWGSPDPARFQFYGRMGMSGIWTGALTTDDIAHLYNGGLGRQYADLVLP